MLTVNHQRSDRCILDKALAASADLHCLLKHDVTEDELHEFLSGGLKLAVVKLCHSSATLHSG